MALRPSGPPPTSPRSNLSRLLTVTLGAEATQSQPELQSQMDTLMQADAENKLRNRKLYLILDLDETLVYSQRLKPGAVPVGHQIMVHNQPFDMVLRPGLETFLKLVQKTYVVFMYTMGDEAYTHAVLDAIDPQRHYFRGAIPPYRASPPCPHLLLVDAAASKPVCRRRRLLLAGHGEPSVQIHEPYGLRQEHVRHHRRHDRRLA